MTQKQEEEKISSENIPKGDRHTWWGWSRDLGSSVDHLSAAIRPYTHQPPGGPLYFFGEQHKHLN